MFAFEVRNRGSRLLKGEGPAYCRKRFTPAPQSEALFSAACLAHWPSYRKTLITNGLH
jgi:hypothetical protein